MHKIDTCKTCTGSDKKDNNSEDAVFVK